MIEKQYSLSLKLVVTFETNNKKEKKVGNFFAWTNISNNLILNDVRTAFSNRFTYNLTWQMLKIFNSIFYFKIE